MRNIINISLPKQMASFVRAEAKRRRFASVSEFMRALVREYEEQKVLEGLRESQKEIEEGKGKVLRSLDDLR